MDDQVGICACRGQAKALSRKRWRGQKRTETNFSPKYLPFILTKAFRACSLVWNSTKILSSPSRRYSIQSQTTPWRQHSCLISSSTPSYSQAILTKPTRTMTSLFSTPWAERAFRAETSGGMRKLRGMALCSIIPELSVVLRTMRGVRMPCPCLPRPYPTLYPNFCIILNATCSFSSTTVPPYSSANMPPSSSISPLLLLTTPSSSS